MKKLLKILATLFIAFCLFSCGGEGNPPSVDSSDDEEIDDVFGEDFEKYMDETFNSGITEGEYLFTLKNNKNANDVITITYLFKLNFDDCEINFKKNDKVIYGAINGKGGRNGKYGYLMLSIAHQEIGSIYLNYEVENGLTLKIGDRNMDYDFVSLTKDGENVSVNSVTKRYKLAGRVNGYKLNDNGDEEQFISKEFHPGETIVLKYVKKENYDFTEKYYLSLYDGQDTKKDFVRAENNVDTLTYTFKEQDIGRKFIMRLNGIEEYEGSTVEESFSDIEVIKP